jgi:hypothetical protein
MNEQTRLHLQRYEAASLAVAHGDEAAHNERVAVLRWYFGDPEGLHHENRESVIASWPEHVRQFMYAAKLV